MSYEVLERQIRALPQAAQEEVAHYVGYLFSLYQHDAEQSDIPERIHSFLQESPDAFDEFAGVREAGVEAIRELTKHDSW